MMRRILLIMISFAILSQTMNSVVIFAGYALNKDFITKTYCVNKDKPKMHCNGKCHLIKELKDNDAKESAPANSAKDKMETLVYLSIISPSLLYSDIVVENVSTPYSERLLADFHTQPFQPPRV